jgi:uncharacterized protein (TIGR02172 family)
MSKGRLLGQGMTAEVYQYGEDKVLKLFYDWFPLEWIKYEASIATAVHQSGAPAPKVHGLVEDSGRNGLIYDLVEGKSMVRAMEAAPWKVASYAKQMARLHVDIHKGISDKLPQQKEILRNFIRESERLLQDKTERIIEYLDSLPEGLNICHGDFHPDNILVSNREVKAIDWNNAYCGNPNADVARTCLTLSSKTLPVGASIRTKLLAGFARSSIYYIYIKEYLKITGKDKKDIDAWILPAAAAKLRDRVPGDEEWLLKIINKLIK